MGVQMGVGTVAVVFTAVKQCGDMVEAGSDDIACDDPFSLPPRQRD